MDINNLPNLVFPDERRGDNEMKFLVVEINGRFFLAIEAFPSNHKRIRKDLDELLAKSGFHGEYRINGGGKIHLFGEKNILIYGVSGDFGAFDAEIVEKIVRKEFPDKEIINEGIAGGGMEVNVYVIS